MKIKIVYDGVGKLIKDHHGRERYINYFIITDVHSYTISDSDITIITNDGDRFKEDLSSIKSILKSEG